MLSLQNQIIWLKRAQWTLTASMALVVAAFMLLAYRPQVRRLADLKVQIDQLQRELASSREKTKILPSVAADVERLRLRLEKFKVLPRQQELAQFIMDIAQLGKQASLKKFEMTPRGSPTRGQKLNELPIHLTFEGDFVNVYSFLRHAEELQRLTRVPEMKIRGKDRLGQVKVDMTMNIYFAAE